MSSSSSLPRLQPSKPIFISLEPLQPSTFSSFGTAILSPLARQLQSIPNSPPISLHASHQPQSQYANQETALKTSPISPLVNDYPPSSPAANNRAESKGLMSIFSCFPRQNTYTVDGDVRLQIEILERHPYTTQTFCPFNFSSSPSSTFKPTYFLVVVAPTVSDLDSDPPNPPDLTRVRAFYAPVTVDSGPGVAVTYNAGTWHAPMVVLGERRVDFLVIQFANGVGTDDCQEVLIGQGGKFGRSVTGQENVVEVCLKELGLDGQDTGLWKSKL